MKKRVFYIILIICIGIIIPKGVLAKNDYYNDEKIIIGYNDSSKEDNANYTYKLYNNSKSLMFESNNSTVTRYGPDGEESKAYNFAYEIDQYHGTNTLDIDYFRYPEELLNISSIEEFNAFTKEKKLHGYSSYVEYNGHYLLNIYDYVPLILENMDTGEKKIVLATLVISKRCYGSEENFSSCYYNTLLLLASDKHYTYNNWEVGSLFNNTLDDNIAFMKDTELKYSDELWEKLNTGPISSTEMNFDDETEEPIPDITENPKTLGTSLIIFLISFLIVIKISTIIIKNHKKNEI